MSKSVWRKSSFSQPNDDCVELAVLDDGTIGVRDSKDNGKGPVLRFTRSAIQTFLAEVKTDEF